MRLSIILVVAALALAGCNANQTYNASAHGDYNPVLYAQTTGFYSGR